MVSGRNKYIGVVGFEHFKASADIFHGEYLHYRPIIVLPVAEFRQRLIEAAIPRWE